MTSFEDVERLGADLLTRFTQHEDQARIYFQLAHVYAQSAQVQPEKTIHYSKKALHYPLAPDQRLRLYVYWGDAVRVAGRKQPFPETRKRAALVYLEGLKEVQKLSGGKNDLQTLKLLQKHRDVMSGQLEQMYSRAPFAVNEFDQLVANSLHDKKFIERIRTKTREGVSDTKDRIRKAEERLNADTSNNWPWTSTTLAFVLALLGVVIIALFTIHYYRSRKIHTPR